MAASTIAELITPHRVVGTYGKPSTQRMLAGRKRRQTLNRRNTISETIKRTKNLIKPKSNVYQIALMWFRSVATVPVAMREGGDQSIGVDRTTATVLGALFKHKLPILASCMEEVRRGGGYVMVD